MKKIWLLIATVSVLISSASFVCADDDSAVKDVLVKYFDATIQGRHKEVYKYLAAESKEGMTLEEYVEKEKREDATNKLEQIFRDKVTYEIKSFDIANTHAKAIVYMTIPNFQEMFTETTKENLTGALTSIFEQKKTIKEAGKTLSGDELMDQVIEKYKKEKVPLTTFDLSIELVKEQGAWKIAVSKK